MSVRLAIKHTNLFRVKDEVAFRKWADSMELNVHEEEIKNEKHFALYRRLIEDDSDINWAHVNFDDMEEEEGETDFRRDLTGHLQEGSIALLLHFEIDRGGFTAHVEAIDSNGGYLVRRLYNIYELAAEKLSGRAELLGGVGLWKRDNRF
jgi:hypothetical protein